MTAKKNKKVLTELTVPQAAKKCKTSEKSVYAALKEGRLDYASKEYKKNVKVNKKWFDYKKKRLKKVAEEKAIQVLETVQSESVKDEDANIDDEKFVDFVSKKNLEQYRDIKYKAAERELKYFTQLGSLMDVETVRHMFTPFIEALFNNLIYIPDKIDDPAIAARVKDLIQVAIKKAKEEADKIIPPKSRKYMTLDDVE